MKKRVISLILILSLLLSCVIIPVHAADEGIERRYYSLSVKHIPAASHAREVEAVFMIRKDSPNGKERLYIKAEDFGVIAAATGGDYEYSQCFTECAFISHNSGHVVRFMLDSADVAVLYVGQSMIYEAPYPTLYENEVVWIPFEFAVKLFYMQAVPAGDTIVINSAEYNPVSAANVAHKKVRSLGFDWIDEVGESAFEDYVGRTSAGIVLCCNDLLSCEVGAWGAMLMCLVGNDYAYDAEFAEEIAKAFIAPSKQELQTVDTNFLSLFVDSVDTYGDFYDERTSADIVKVFDNIVKNTPELSKNQSVDEVRKLLTSKNSSKFATEVVEGLDEAYKDFGKNSANIMGYFLDFVKLMEYYLMFLNKSERAVAALELYAQDSHYGESRVFMEYASTTGSDFMDATQRFILDNLDSYVGGATNLMGTFGAKLSLVGLVWDLASGIGPLKSIISTAENRRISDYAVKYQAESLGMYYDHRNAYTANPGISEKKLENMLNSLYAYLKFSYIARNAAAGAFRDNSKLLMGNEALDQCAQILSEKNQEVAKLLTLMEQDVFTSADAKKYNWDDAVYIKKLDEYGTAVDCPTQRTTPVAEIAAFPGADPIEYITEAEAVAIAEKVTSRLTGGIMDGAIGDYFKEVLGVDEIYSHKCLGRYDFGKKSAYIVALQNAGRTEALYFVSVVGTEVWLGVESSAGEYFVYTDLDLLHADLADLLSAGGSLVAQLIEILQEAS